MNEGWWLLIEIAILWWLNGKRTARSSSADAASLLHAEPLHGSARPSAAPAPAGPRHALRAERRPETIEPPRWIAAGESVGVQGIRIDGGLIYVGSVGRASPYERDRRDAHIIDPAAPVDVRTADVAGQTISYWPSYSDLTPSARRAYLQWLAGGRRDSGFDIGHVFLFFYGLEFRLFGEGAWQDAHAIVTEVEALLEIYGAHGSFAGYARRFLDAVALSRAAVLQHPVLDPKVRSVGEMALGARVALGKRLTEGRLTGDWLLSWYLAHPETVLRTPATRCFEEFSRLFQMRFAAQYPKGLSVRIPVKRLEVIYRPASGIPAKTVTGPHTAWPDPAGLTAPIKVAAAIATDCTNALDGYSRLLGRNPAARGTLATHVLLPPGLADPAAGGLAAFGTKVTTLAPDGVAETTIGVLLAMADVNPEGNRKLSAAALQSLSMGLAAVGFGIEPDPRFGGKITGVAAPVLLFRSKDGAQIDATRPAYAAARALVEVGAIAATVDASNAAAGLQAVQAEIGRLAELTAAERLRLQAYLTTIRRASPNQKGALQKLSAYADDQRQRIARVALGALVADRRVGADEVKFAERLYKALGLASDQLYADLHGAMGDRPFGKDEPPTVSAAEPATGGMAIPPPRSQPPPRGAVVDKAPPVAVRRSLDQNRLSEQRRAADNVRRLMDGAASDFGGFSEEGDATPYVPPRHVAAAAVKPIVDNNVLVLKREETRAVHGLLSNVFTVEDEADAAMAETTNAIEAEPQAVRQSPFIGLDPEHGALVELLLTRRGSVDRVEFETAVSQHGLFVDGALETINDWAYGRFDEPLIDDGDPLTVPAHLVAQLQEVCLIRHDRTVTDPPPRPRHHHSGAECRRRAAHRSATYSGRAGQ